MDGSSTYAFTMCALIDEVASLEVSLCLSVGSSIRASWIHMVCKLDATVSGVGVWGLLQRITFQDTKGEMAFGTVLLVASGDTHGDVMEVTSLSSESSGALRSVSVLSDVVPLWSPSACSSHASSSVSASPN